jgi:hypothetical protein
MDSADASVVTLLKLHVLDEGTTIPDGFDVVGVLFRSLKIGDSKAFSAGDVASAAQDNARRHAVWMEISIDRCQTLFDECSNSGDKKEEVLK